MSQIIASLLPIVLLVAAGAVLLRAGFFDGAFRQGLDRLVYWVALPALFIAKLSVATSLGGANGMILVFCAASVIAMLASYVIGWAIGLPASSRGVFAQASFRGNLAFVGLPVLVLAVQGDASIISRAVLVLAPAVLLYNVMGVVVLSIAQQRFDRGTPLRLVRSMVTNPLLLSCALGLLLAWLRLPPWPPVLHTLELLGDTAAPLALLSLGGAVATYKVHRHAAAGVACALVKLVLLPAVVLGLSVLVGLDRSERVIVLIFAATPTAVASYVLAVQLRGDPGLAASTIVISTVLSILSLAAALALA